jgi:hypothetical protein
MLHWWALHWCHEIVTLSLQYGVLADVLLQIHSEDGVSANISVFVVVISIVWWWLDLTNLLSLCYIFLIPQSCRPFAVWVIYQWFMIALEPVMPFICRNSRQYLFIIQYSKHLQWNLMLSSCSRLYISPLENFVFCYSVGFTIPFWWNWTIHLCRWSMREHGNIVLLSWNFWNLSNISSYFKLVSQHIFGGLS